MSRASASIRSAVSDLWAMVQALKHDGMAVVWSTAYLDEAERCDTVLMLNDGRIEFDGPPQELTARVVGAVHRLVGLRDDRRARSGARRSICPACATASSKATRSAWC